MLRFFGHIVGGDDPDIAFRLRAAAYLPVDQSMTDAGEYEYAGGTTSALRAFAKKHHTALKADGLEVVDIDDQYGKHGYANRLFALRARPLLVPHDEELADPHARAAGVDLWMPAGVA